MPTCGVTEENLSPHIRYFERRCIAKGAHPVKAAAWARYQVRRGKRAPMTKPAPLAGRRRSW